jgi:hypothetical protein
MIEVKLVDWVATVMAFEGTVRGLPGVLRETAKTISQNSLCQYLNVETYVPM